MPDYAAIVSDPDLWARLREIVLPVVDAEFREAYLTGAELGALQRPVPAGDDDDGFKALPGIADLLAVAYRALDPGQVPEMPFDYEAINAASAEVIAAYRDAWWDQFSASTQRQMRDIFTRAESLGLSTADVTRELAPLFGLDRARRIAASELTNLLGMGAQETYRRAGFGRWEWRTVRDARVDPVCRDRHKQRYPMSVPFRRAHVNCVLPGTLVSGAIAEGATARAYDGDVVVILTTRGNEITVTPNHPVLTPRGWIAAGLLRVGDEIVEDVRPQGMAVPLRSPNDVEMPSRVEDVAGALLGAGGVLLSGMPVAAEDFHGDGAGGDVDVVWADRDLMTRFVSGGREPRSQLAFLDACSPLVSLPGPGTPLQFGSVRLASASGVMSSTRLLVPTLDPHLRPLEALGIAPASWLDSISDEAPPDGVALYAQLTGQRSLGGASEVPAYDLGLVERVLTKRYRGHVYNLQTAGGYYTGNGIVTSNCRCWPVPVGTPAVQGSLFGAA